jgi:ADP-heptose:LPS heptosyltransferase
MRKLKKLNLIKVYDLQNSSRTKFYKSVLFPKQNFDKWSSSETTLPTNITKEEFDKNPVLERFEHQLKASGLKTLNTMKPDFNWSCTNIDEIKKEYSLDKYIVLFPFCSVHLEHKKWPHYNELINLIKNKYKDQLNIVVAPGPEEIKDAKQINATCVLNNDISLNISQLATLIRDSSFVIANDTGPAHMAAHLDAKGLTLFGKHTTAFKVSIERENFKAIQVSDLNKLSANKVFEKIEEKIN